MLVRVHNSCRTVEWKLNRRLYFTLLSILYANVSRSENVFVNGFKRLCPYCVSVCLDYFCLVVGGAF